MNFWAFCIQNHAIGTFLHFFLFCSFFLFFVIYLEFESQTQNKFRIKVLSLLQANKCGSILIRSMKCNYRMPAIISSGFYIFYPIFEDQFNLLFQGFFNFWELHKVNYTNSYVTCKQIPFNLKVSEWNFEFLITVAWPWGLNHTHKANTHITKLLTWGVWSGICLSMLLKKGKDRISRYRYYGMW